MWMKRPQVAILLPCAPVSVRHIPDVDQSTGGRFGQKWLVWGQTIYYVNTFYKAVKKSLVLGPAPDQVNSIWRLWPRTG